MDFILRLGHDFTETFEFKNENGKLIALNSGSFRLVLERGTFAREYTDGNGLVRHRTKVVWNITKEESKNFEFSTLYYTLYLNDLELSRGVLKTQ